jgi:2-dehydro-3-deoxygalactonokinase
MLGLSDGVFCIPGTHCKWVRISGGEIVAFRSVLTGEFYQTLQKAGSLAPLFPAEVFPFDREAFHHGLRLAAEGQDLLNDVWQVRSHRIRGDYPAAHLQSLLSGILIGHEMRAVHDFVSADESVILLSDPGERRDCYQQAISYAGWTIHHIVEGEEAVCAGMLALIAAYRPS